MEKEDSVQIKLLESMSNLRRAVSKNLGFELASERANQICSLLQQARLFYEAAENAPWEIKPLVVYYGLAAFSKAVVLVRNRLKLENLAQSHGLSDISENNSKLESLTVKVTEPGTFHEMNDVFSPLQKLILTSFQPTVKIPCPTASSTTLSNRSIKLKEILARIPGLEDVYYETFGEDPNIVRCSQFLAREWGDMKQVELHIFGYTHTKLVDFESIKTFTHYLRQKFGFLKNWRPLGQHLRELTL